MNLFTRNIPHYHLLKYLLLLLKHPVYILMEAIIFLKYQNWTHVYMNLLTRNIPQYHLLKYLLFLLKHPVYVTVQTFPVDKQMHKMHIKLGHF
jgi:hypothetical protein